MNTGTKKSLWTWLDQQSNSLKGSLPILKIWCAVHRSSLAWGDLCKSVGEVKRIINDAKAIATYFHISAIRTEELSQTGKYHGVEVLHFPTYFEVRWAQYVHELLRAVLHNWVPLMLHWGKTELLDKEARGFKRTWSELGRLKLLALLIDILVKLARFQQRLQSDDTLVLDVRKRGMDFVKQLKEMEAMPITGKLPHYSHDFISILGKLCVPVTIHNTRSFGE